MPTAISLLALSIAVTGTAWAATGQLVNIADPTAAGNIAKVDSTGALKTTAPATPPQPPAKPLTRWALLYIGDNTVIAPTSGTVAIGRIGASNYGKQYNGSTMQVTVRQAGDTGDGTCGGTRVTLATYDANPGQTVVDGLPTPLVLKPMTGYPRWCLIATATLPDTAGSYYNPHLYLNGYSIGSVTVPSTRSSASAKPRLTRTGG
jgi:hypothetical protein